MLPIICSCGEILGNKQLIYETEMKNVCELIGLDYNAVSQGIIDTNDEYVKARQKIVKTLCRRPCCKQAIMNYIDLVIRIKG